MGYCVGTRHSDGDLAMHRVAVMVALAWCHLARVHSQCWKHQLALEEKMILKFVSLELSRQGVTV